MGAALAIRDDLTATELRRHARCAPNPRAALRLLALAEALAGLSRAAAARLAGRARQALHRRDAGARANAVGRAGLRDRPKPGRPPRRDAGEPAALAARVFRDPDPDEDGVAAWTRADLGRWLADRFGQELHPSSLSRVLRRLEPSRQKARPVHPRVDPAARARFRTKGGATP